MLIVCLIFFSFVLNAEEYYLNSITGNDTFPGTQDKPFATWATAVSKIKYNDVIKFSSDTDMPDYNSAMAIIMVQEDMDSSVIKTDLGSWKERIIKQKKSSKNAGLECIEEYKYVEKKRRRNGKKYMKCVSRVHKVFRK
jgi:hypothetical protein